MNVPPAPLGWNKTIADLSAEANKGIRKTVGRPEIDWARDYERSLLPEGIRFPKKGDIYEAIEDIPVCYMTAWRAPFTGGGDSQLNKGERVVIKDEPIDSRPIGVYAEAVNYASLEERIVPSAERSNPKYAGFYFSFKTLELNQKFRLVSE